MHSRCADCAVSQDLEGKRFHQPKRGEGKPISPALQLPTFHVCLEDAGHLPIYSRLVYVLAKRKSKYFDE